MSPKTFFVLTLALPIVGGAICALVPPLEGFAFVSQVALIPYIACAAFLAILTLISRSERHLVLISVLAPLLMCLVVAAFVTVLDPPEIPASPNRFLRLASDMPIVGLISYAYVALAWILFYAARRLRIVEVSAPPNNHMQRTGSP